MLRYLILVSVGLSVHTAGFASDRLAQVDALKSEYDAAVADWRKEFTAPADGSRMSTERSIEAYEQWPAWSFLPRFLRLASEKPDDDAAYECCQWVLDCVSAVGSSESRMFSADTTAWEMLATHHTDRDDLPRLCLQAAQYPGPARESFLRKLRNDPESSREAAGFATTALAQLLSQKYELASMSQRRDQQQTTNEFNRYLRSQESPEWAQYIDATQVQRYRQQAIEIFRDAQSNYHDIPVSITAPYFRNLNTLGEKADKSLHALEHLVIGAVAPNITGVDLHGEPLDLKDYRGKVVLLSFWFPGCAPCLGLVPEEKNLLETFQGRPFALLGICHDDQREVALEVAEEHGMDWPIWFENPKGPIVTNWNVLSWPTLYVLDAEGRIVEKGLRGEDLEQFLIELVEQQESQTQQRK
ncbi:redoxin domain-containing protein [Aeoliella sp.]|uniref:TlpA family protein disulfide reductase n=1 Tax=Aeoliella sp. TaxID=2795800 RepID=UPI003CCBE136